MPLLKGGIFVSGGLVREWAFNYIAWQPGKLVSFGLLKRYYYCSDEERACVIEVDHAIMKMIKL